MLHLPDRRARLLAGAARVGAVRLIAGAVALQLAAGVTAAVRIDDAPSPRIDGATSRARSLPQPPDPSVQAVADREAAVTRLLAARSAAVLGRDRDAFLATVDPRATALRARQAALFDALAQVPLSRWDYALVSGVERSPDPALDTRYGRGQWWGPDVTLSYALAGFDARPVLADHYLTFVRHDGRWLLGADDDFAAAGLVTPRALWDRGPVEAVRERGVLVLGRPGQGRLLANLATLTADAIPRVTAVWGDWAKRAVVLVPSSADELSQLLGTEGDLSKIAAVATAELRGGTDDYDPAGDRVLVNPDAFPRLGQLGRRVVLTHEIAHVATRQASGPAVPAWLAEGFADYIGYQDVDVPLAVSARDLRRDVKAGRLPAALPADDDFDGESGRLAQAYEGSWLAVRLLAERHGEPALLRFYRRVGARRGTTPEAAVEQALRAELGTTTTRFTADWRAALRAQLG